MEVLLMNRENNVLHFDIILSDIRTLDLHILFKNCS